MKEFFNVINLDEVFEYIYKFPPVGVEKITLPQTIGRILAEDIISEIDLPDFRRATMDGFAVQGVSTFGASEGNPAYLSVKGAVVMGESPDYSIGPGEVVKISTGVMLPQGADSVIMIEHTGKIDEATIEAYRSVAPGQNIIEVGEDYAKGTTVLAQTMIGGFILKIYNYFRLVRFDWLCMRYPQCDVICFHRCIGDNRFRHESQPYSLRHRDSPSSIIMIVLLFALRFRL